ncbi:MAG: choice-of-anchor J domain-containing protein [Bacteroidota bacterium]
MSPGGLDELSGNGFDTDNNVNDFVTRNPQPQNSASKIEPDIVPPMFASGYPLVVNPSENSCELVLNMNEAGKIHYVVLPSGAAAPSSLQVTLGQDSNGSVASIKGSVPITIVDSDISKTIADLQSSTSYYVYAVGRDVAGNLQVSPVRIEVTTTESTVPVITPSLSSLDFPGFTDKSKQSISRLYSIAADHLVSNMIVSVSGNFHISEDDINYTSSLTINKNLLSGGALKVIYVKFNPGGNVGTQPGIITHSSTGAADQQIFLSGNAIDPFVQDFNDPDFLLKSGWTQFSRLGDQTWASTNFGHTCLTACTSATADKAAQINGFSGGAIENEDWLISPNLDLTGFVNFPVISFWTVSAFAGNGLKLKYSSDYPGSGDPALATWTDLDGKFPVPNSSLWTRSSGIILPKTLVYVAIVYTSGIDAASRWTFDDWKVEDASGYLDVPVILFSFGEVVTGSHSASQNFAFVSKGYGDVTVSAPEGFEISLDDISFANSQVIPQANVSSGKTIYIRFSPPAKRIKWNGTLVFTGNGLDTSLGSLAGSSYPRSETFDITTYNLEFFGTDVKNASNKEFGPPGRCLTDGKCFCHYAKVRKRYLCSGGSLR